MIDVTDHARTKWLVRGDTTRRIREAWRSGIQVKCPHYSYDSARLDTDSATILLLVGGSITTVLRAFDNTVYHFRVPVKCFDCGQHHHSTKRCPQCGSSLWRCR